MNMYIVEALRWGDRELHSYIVGVYSKIEYAEEAAEAEADWRGGKYECVVTECELDVQQKCLSSESVDEKERKARYNRTMTPAYKAKDPDYYTTANVADTGVHVDSLKNN